MKLQIKSKLTQRDIEERKLLEKYPKLFRQKDSPMTETALCWGLQCDRGWFPVIDILCSQLQFDIDRNHYPQIEFTTIKEKYGSLRLYYNGRNEKQEGMIDFVEFLSDYICEHCGSMEDVQQTKGYIQSLCKKCRKPQKWYSHLWQWICGGLE